MASHSQNKQELSYSDGFTAGYARGWSAAVIGLREAIMIEVEHAHPRSSVRIEQALIDTLEAIAKGEITPNGYRTGGFVTSAMGGTDTNTPHA